jgi:uncharacterized coiled-coil DUF342 family protein
MSNQWWEEYPRPSWLVRFWAKVMHEVNSLSVMGRIRKGDYQRLAQKLDNMQRERASLVREIEVHRARNQELCDMLVRLVPNAPPTATEMAAQANTERLALEAAQMITAKADLDKRIALLAADAGAVREGMPDADKYDPRDEMYQRAIDAQRQTIHKLQDELACLRSELSGLGAAIKANGE